MDFPEEIQRKKKYTQMQQVIDVLMDERFGKVGTPERETFRKEAYAYCVDQIISEDPKSSLGWVYNKCTFSEKNGIQEEVQRTFMFHQFYIKLFDLELEGDFNSKGELPSETKDMYTQIDELHILLEDVHQ